MALSEMRRVYIIGEESLREPLVKKLAELALFQPEELEQEEINSHFKKREFSTEELEDNLSKLNWTIEYLAQFDGKKGGLGLFPVKTPVKKDIFFNWSKHFNWQEVHGRCEEMKDELENLKKQKDALQGREGLLQSWKEVTFPLEKLQKDEYLSYQLGTIPRENKIALQHELEKQKETYYLDIIREEEGIAYFLLIFFKEYYLKIDSILQKLKVAKVQLKASPKEELKDVENKANQTMERLNEIEKELQEISQEKTKLMSVYDYLYHLLRERRVSIKSHFTPYTFSIGGWIKKIDIDKLKEGLKSLPALEIVTRVPHRKEKHKIPIALSNRSFFKPFELVVELYGIPHYFEIDPTPFLAPFFALFLAICLTDAGYGIILSLLAYIGLKKFKIGEGGKKLFLILFITGLITFAIGIMTGGIFGIELSQLPPSLAFLEKLTLLNPMQEPMVFLLICLALGVIHILVGIALEVWDKLKRKEIASAILDHFSWLAIVIGLLLILSPLVTDMFLGGVQSGTSGEGLSGTGLSISFSPENIMKIWNGLPGYSKIGVVMFLWGMLALFLFVGRKSKSLFTRFAKGGYELYGIVQIFADILSYSRLLALGLATAVIASVINTIAVMLGETPFIGPVLMVIILIVGHMGNILISCLSGFIHTCRLQFVEFFIKFYEGGGTSFKPFQREGKYTNIIE